MILEILIISNLTRWSRGHRDAYLVHGSSPSKCKNFCRNRQSGIEAIFNENFPRNGVKTFHILKIPRKIQERSGDISGRTTAILQFSSELEQTWHSYYWRP
jgi:hypothetical protein